MRDANILICSLSSLAMAALNCLLYPSISTFKFAISSVVFILVFAGMVDEGADKGTAGKKCMTYLTTPL